MINVSMSSKGQIVIPLEVRKRLGMSAGTKLELREVAGEVRLRPASRPGKTATLESALGLARYKGPAISVEQMDEGIRRRMRREWAKK
jgi:AbrB family looped-hinge helix DNA binding protein